MLYYENYLKDYVKCYFENGKRKTSFDSEIHSKLCEIQHLFNEWIPNKEHFNLFISIFEYLYITKYSQGNIEIVIYPLIGETLGHYNNISKKF